MEILLCLDKNFVSQVCLFIHSIVVTNESMPIHFHIVHDTDTVQYAIEKYIKDNRIHAKFSFYKINAGELKLPINTTYLSTATYFRLFAPQLLPLELNKILYLDIDMLAVDSLDELWNTDITNYSAAVVHDLMNDDIRVFNRLHYPFGEGYFNAGLLLINLAYWRKNDIANKVLQYIADYPERCIMHDQDALNAILHGTVKFISARYNTLVTFYKEHPENALVERSVCEKIQAEIKSPAILHFAGGIKPWHYEYHRLQYPFAHIWRCYLQNAHVPLHLSHTYLCDEKNLLNDIKIFLSYFGLVKNIRDYFVDTSAIENTLLSRTEQNRTEQNRTEQNRTEQNRTR